MNEQGYQLDAFSQTQDGYRVERIKPSDTHYLILNVHYARRLPSITHAFALFNRDSLRGIVTYGTSASSTLRRGIAGEQWAGRVIELNRLCLVENEPNQASRLVGASLRMLPAPTIVVSFADIAQGHEGIVYQATNFLYTGLSAKFRDPRVVGLEHQHHTTYAHGMTNAEVKQKYGEGNVYFVDRSRKHRYIKLVGNKYQKREMMDALRYKVLPYPKEEK